MSQKWSYRKGNIFRRSCGMCVCLCVTGVSAWSTKNGRKYDKVDKQFLNFISCMFIRLAEFWCGKWMIKDHSIFAFVRKYVMIKLDSFYLSAWQIFLLRIVGYRVNCTNAEHKCQQQCSILLNLNLTQPINVANNDMFVQYET